VATAIIHELGLSIVCGCQQVVRGDPAEDCADLTRRTGKQPAEQAMVGVSIWIN